MKIQFTKDKGIFYSVIAISTILSSCDNYIGGSDNHIDSNKMKLDIISKEFKPYPEEIQKQIDGLERVKNDLQQKLAEGHHVFLLDKKHRDEHKIMNDDRFNSIMESIKKCDEQLKELKNSIKD